MSFPNQKGSTLGLLLFLLCVNDVFEELNLLHHKSLNHKGYVFIAKEAFAEQPLIYNFFDLFHRAITKC